VGGDGWDGWGGWGAAGRISELDHETYASPALGTQGKPRAIRSDAFCTKLRQCKFEKLSAAAATATPTALPSSCRPGGSTNHWHHSCTCRRCKCGSKRDSRICRRPAGKGSQHISTCHFNSGIAWTVGCSGMAGTNMLVPQPMQNLSNGFRLAPARTRSIPRPPRACARRATKIIPATLPRGPLVHQINP
jgi:hypothetical protein